MSSEFVYEKTRAAMRGHLNETASYILSHFPGMDEEYLIRRSRIKFRSLRDMLLAIHAPASLQTAHDGIAAARALSAFEVVFNAERQTAKKPNPKSVINVREGDIARLIATFPHELTYHQREGIADIVKDLRAPYQMCRLLSGDVGFGKTEVAVIPAIAAQYSGAKVVIMCPSLIIVNQWVEKIQGYGKDIPVVVVSRQNRLNKEDLASNPILVGTTALVSRLPKIDHLPDFVIFDEQQKHGKNHKEQLVGPNTNRLEATATCQPKTAALVFYGGMDETILNQCPVSKKVTSRIVRHNEKRQLFARINTILDTIQGSQIAIVYPNVSVGTEKGSLLSAAVGWEKQFPGQVGILHGAMTDDEKTQIIARMHADQIRILLSSILIETGITLPSLRGMVVVGADRFGVSSLHQLRGRLARHGGVGYFYMLLPNDDVAEDTIARLELVAKHQDGFVLVEKDAEMRGYGSLGEDDDKQSGVSRSAMFFGMRLMPKDIERALG